MLKSIPSPLTEKIKLSSFSLSVKSDSHLATRRNGICSCISKKRVTVCTRVTCVHVCTRVAFWNGGPSQSSFKNRDPIFQRPYLEKMAENQK